MRANQSIEPALKSRDHDGTAARIVHTSLQIGLRPGRGMPGGPTGQLRSTADSGRVGAADAAAGASGGATRAAGGIRQRSLGVAAGGQQQQSRSDGDEPSNHGLFFRQGAQWK